MVCLTPETLALKLMQLSLSEFDASYQELNIAPCDGELYLYKQFYNPQQTENVFSHLKTRIAWQEETLHIYEKWYKLLRLMCWYVKIQWVIALKG